MGISSVGALRCERITALLFNHIITIGVFDIWLPNPLYKCQKATQLEEYVRHTCPSIQTSCFHGLKEHLQLDQTRDLFLHTTISSAYMSFPIHSPSQQYTSSTNQGVKNQGQATKKRITLLHCVSPVRLCCAELVPVDAAALEVEVEVTARVLSSFP